MEVKDEALQSLQPGRLSDGAAFQERRPRAKRRDRSRPHHDAGDVHPLHRARLLLRRLRHVLGGHVGDLEQRVPEHRQRPAGLSRQPAPDDGRGDDRVAAVHPRGGPGHRRPRQAPRREQGLRRGSTEGPDGPAAPVLPLLRHRVRRGGIRAADLPRLAHEAQHLLGGDSLLGPLHGREPHLGPRPLGELQPPRRQAPGAGAATVHRRLQPHVRLHEVRADGGDAGALRLQRDPVLVCEEAAHEPHRRHDRRLRDLLGHRELLLDGQADQRHSPVVCRRWQVRHRGLEHRGLHPPVDLLRLAADGDLGRTPVRPRRHHTVEEGDQAEPRADLRRYGSGLHHPVLRDVLAPQLPHRRRRHQGDDHLAGGRLHPARPERQRDGTSLLLVSPRHLHLGVHRRGAPLLAHAGVDRHREPHLPAPRRAQGLRRLRTLTSPTIPMRPSATADGPFLLPPH